MDQNKRILGLSGEITIDKVKQAYFREIHKYPPEEFEDEFIKITKAYEELTHHLKEKEIHEKNKSLKDTIDIFFASIEKGIEKDDYRLINDSILSINRIIDINNFEIVSGYCVDFIMKLNSYKNFSEARVLAIYLENAFNKIGVYKLEQKYRDLEMILIVNANRRDYGE